MPPTISVITCCFNSAKFLNESLVSIQRQTFTDYEHIIVDDGSTDETWNIIKSYEQQFWRVKAYKKEHTGFTDSLNFALSKATGKFVACLDSDDISMPDRLEKQITLCKQRENVVLCGTGFHEIDESGRTVRTFFLPSDSKKLIRRLETFQTFFPHSSVIYNRAIVDKIGRYNPRYKKSQDADLWLRLTQFGNIACCPEALIKLRKHSSSISFQKTGFSQRVYGYASLIGHWRRKFGFSDPNSWTDEKWKQYLNWINKELTYYERPNFLSFFHEIRTKFLRRESASRDWIKLFSMPMYNKDFFQWILHFIVSPYLGKKLALKSSRRWL